MKALFASGLMAATASAVTTVGDGVPLIYASEPYPATVYNGTQYNATTINGVPYNASNEWPCLDAKGYESIIPSCSLYCIDLALRSDGCEVDDFVCHCETLHSNKIDTVVVPCLTTGDTATCNSEEIGELVNFVHGALCPYFEAVTDAYKTCPTVTQNSSSSTLATSTAQWTTSTWTTAEHSWTTVCPEPTATSTSTWVPMATGGSGTYKNSTLPAVTSAPSYVATGAASSVRVRAAAAAVVAGVVAVLL
jgi:hypothetical protein